MYMLQFDSVWHCSSTEWLDSGNNNFELVAQFPQPARCRNVTEGAMWSPPHPHLTTALPKCAFGWQLQTLKLPKTRPDTAEKDQRVSAKRKGPPPVTCGGESWHRGAGSGARHSYSVTFTLSATHTQNILNEMSPPTSTHLPGLFSQRRTCYF